MTVTETLWKQEYGPSLDSGLNAAGCKMSSAVKKVESFFVGLEFVAVEVDLTLSKSFFGGECWRILGHEDKAQSKAHKNESDHFANAVFDYHQMTNTLSA